MQEFISNPVREMKNYLEWIGSHYDVWEYTWDGSLYGAANVDKIEILEALKEEGRYPQILNLMLDESTEMRYLAMRAIIEEISETWGKNEWDNVVKRLVDKLRANER